MDCYIKGQVLELHKRTKEGKTYFTLLVFEPGKDYPELTKISVHPDRVESAEKLVGHNCAIQGDMRIFRGNANINFLAGKIESQVKAA